jgi:predicted lipoprotein with Yx(FWY)xxD motif
MQANETERATTMYQSIIRTAFASVAVLALSAGVSAAAPAHTAKTSLGRTLVDAQGMTLYTFMKDKDGKSACNGPCAANWPALMASAGAKATGKYSIVTRDDGSKQWAYKGKPLYTWVKDMKPGDTTGDGFLNGAWHAAKP